MRAVHRALLAVVALMMSMSIAGCSRSVIIFVDEDATYSFTEIEGLPAALGRPEYAGRPTSDASDLRREALVDLRGMGSDAAELAEFITRTLPTQTRAVPYYGETAEVDGSEAWIVVELWGTADGALDKTRTWVFDRASGDVLYSSSGK